MKISRVITIFLLLLFGICSAFQISIIPPRSKCSSPNSIKSRIGQRIRNLCGGRYELPIQQPHSPGFTSANARKFLALASLMNGSNYVCTKMLQDSIPAALLTFLRFLIATLFFVPTLLTEKVHPLVTKGAIEIGITQAIGFISQATALQYASASKVAFFSCLSVVVCPVIDILADFFHTKSNAYKHRGATKRDFIGPLLALLGVAFLEFGGLDAVKWTDLFILVIPIAFASGFHKSEQLGKKYPGVINFNTGVQMVTVTALSLLWTLAIGSFPVSGHAFRGLFRKLTKWQVFVGLLHAGVVTTAWTQLTEQKAIRVLSAGDTALMYTLEPLFAAAISAAVLKERIGLDTVLGALCIMTACIWSALELSPKRLTELITGITKSAKAAKPQPINYFNGDSDQTGRWPPVANSSSGVPRQEMDALYTYEPVKYWKPAVEVYSSVTASPEVLVVNQTRFTTRSTGNPDAIVLRNAPIRPDLIIEGAADANDVLRAQQAVSRSYIVLSNHNASSNTSR